MGASICRVSDQALCHNRNEHHIFRIWSITQTLQTYAAIFTKGDTDDNDSTIILANGITIDELNKEKSKTVDKVINKE